MVAWDDEAQTQTNTPSNASFLFAGLASLMDLQLCQAIRKIRYINKHGLTKMIRNILALQQNLRNIVVIHETSNAVKGDNEPTAGKQSWQAARQASSDGFQKSMKLWELVGRGPEVGCVSGWRMLTLGADYTTSTGNAGLDSLCRISALF